MTHSATFPETTLETTRSRWQELADDVLAGETITTEQALAVLECPDEELLDLMSAVYRVGGDRLRTRFSSIF